MSVGRPPLVAITADAHEGRLRVSQRYAACVARAGALPIVIGPDGEGGPDPRDIVDRFDAFVFTGGGDPRTEPFGAPTHPGADVMDQARQAFETRLLILLERVYPSTPVLGVCLGMQLMALCAGGRLNQHLPDDTPSADDHAADRPHPIVPASGARFLAGQVTSRHHQAVAEPGRLRTVGHAHDGIIEAVDDPSRPFCLGVQWHPERTADYALGQALFDGLVRACASQWRAPAHG